MNANGRESEILEGRHAVPSGLFGFSPKRTPAARRPYPKPDLRRDAFP